MNQICFFDEMVVNTGVSKFEEVVTTKEESKTKDNIVKIVTKKKGLPIIEFIKDCSKTLHNTFVIGSQAEVFMESKDHYIILMEDGVFYQPFKSNCKLVRG